MSVYVVEECYDYEGCSVRIATNYFVVAQRKYAQLVDESDDYTKVVIVEWTGENSKLVRSSKQ